MGRKQKVSAGIGARIASLYEGKDRKQFARELGISDRTLSNYVRGVNKPPERFLALLRERLGVDLNWLVTGNLPPAAAPRRTVDKREFDAFKREARESRLDPLVWTAAGLTLFWIGALLAMIALVP